MHSIYLILLATGLGAGICKSREVREDEKLPEFVESYPFFATILYRHKPICIGTIVTDSFILCSHSCVEGMSLSLIEARVQSSDALAGGSSEKVKNLILRPFDAVVALIEVTQKILFNRIDQISLELFQPDKKSAVGHRATLVCLGPRVSEVSQPLRALEVGIVADAKCNTGNRVIPNNMICVVTIDDLSDLCPNGILGAPFLVNGRQIGMISADQYPTPGRPTAYLNIIPYADWIYETTSVSEDRPGH